MKNDAEFTQRIQGFLEKLNNNSDVKTRFFSLGEGTRCCAAFLEGASDGGHIREMIQRLMLFRAESKKAHNFPFGKAAAQRRTAPKPQTPDSEAEPIIKELLAGGVISGGVSVLNEPDEAVQTVLNADTVLFVDGCASMLMIATAAWNTRAISEPPTTNVLRGPREGFTEYLKTNLTMLRRRLKTPDLIFDRVSVGRRSNTDVCIAYIKSIADGEIVAKIKERLNKIDIDGVIDSAYLQQFLEEYSPSLFRQTGIGEKPDIITAKILEGRAAVFCDGSPIVLTLPFLFYEDLQQSEDYYSNTLRARFLRFLRIFGLITGLALPGVYVSIQAFHYTVLPPEFLMTMLNSIAGVPLSPVFEMLFVLLLFEIIHEASFRMPKYVGMAMSIVGALVLGDTAVKAGLISSPAIMIVAISAISFYAVPDQVGPLSLLRLMFTLAGGALGLFGIVLLGLVVIVYLAALDSYGTPYLAPFAPRVSNDMADGLLKDPADEIYNRPYSIPGKNKTRLKK